MSDPFDVEIVVPDGPRVRLDKALATCAPEGAALSRSRLRSLIEAGAVTGPDGAVRDPAQTARPGLYVVEVPAPVSAVPEAEDIPLNVVYEDDELIVVNKPPGMVVHPAPGAERGTLVNALLHHCGDSLVGIGGEVRPGIVHRIDKDTSGLLVVAKTDAAHQGLAAQFADHSAERRYDALCWGAPDAGDPRLAGLEAVSFEAGGILRIDAPLARHPQDRKRMAVRAGGRRAVTRVTVHERFGPLATPWAARISCRLETGRTHQIRVHLAHLGHGLVGDPVYGRARTARNSVPEPVAAFPRQVLHAATLGFRHPAREELLRFEVEPPQDHADIIAKIREASRKRG
ncbi:MAG: RluA family pseudouridine synthase [Pseudomonadota bacterium]